MKLIPNEVKTRSNQINFILEYHATSITKLHRFAIIKTKIVVCCQVEISKVMSYIRLKFRSKIFLLILGENFKIKKKVLEFLLRIV